MEKIEKKKHKEGIRLLSNKMPLRNSKAIETMGRRHAFKTVHITHTVLIHSDYHKYNIELVLSKQEEQVHETTKKNSFSEISHQLKNQKDEL